MTHSARREEHVEAVVEGRSRLELPFLRNTWYVAGWGSEFDSTAPSGRTIAGEPLVLYRQADGSLVALHDRCPHRLAPLSLGRIEGSGLRCMYHGLKFSAAGRCIEIPHQERIPPSLCVRTFPVLEKHRFAWIWGGDPALADPTLIPDLSMLDEAWRRVYYGSLDYEANYALVNDNLLDLSHISFLHEKSVGRPVTGQNAGVAPIVPGGSQARPLRRGVRVESWICGPSARNVLLPARMPDGDLWTRTDFVVPGIFTSVDRLYPAGTAERCNSGPPDSSLSALSDSMSIQAVTPSTARRTRYFYSFGPRAADLDRHQSDAMWEIVKQTFSEDLQMIQAQQKMLATYPGHGIGGIAADRGITLFRNLMKKMIAADGK